MREIKTNFKKISPMLISMFLASCVSHSSEGNLVVAAVVMSPILIPISIVKGTAEIAGSSIKDAKLRNSISNGDVYSCIKALNSSYRRVGGDVSLRRLAAQKMVELHQANRLNESRWENVLYLAESYRVLSESKAHGVIKIDQQDIDNAVIYMNKYVKQKEKTCDIPGQKEYSEECGPFLIRSDREREILRDINADLFCMTLTNLDKEERAKILDQRYRASAFSEDETVIQRRCK